MTKQVEEKQRVVIRFAGDSGDGMQLTGDRFTNATAVLGNDLATLPDFPAEIRAPAGTVHGVSAFQIQFASTDILTPGDHPNVLVAMNPAALKAELATSRRAGRSSSTRTRSPSGTSQKAGYTSDPLTDGTLDGYQVYRVPMTSITVRAVEELGLTRKEAERSKNMFALGLVSWMYGRPTDVTLNWLHKKFGDKPQVYDANVAAFKAGYNFGETTELFATSYMVKAAPAAARRLPERLRGAGAGLGARRRLRTQRPPPVLRELPDHAGLRAAARAVAAEELRRHDPAGRGRDRGRQRRARRGLRRRPRRDGDERTRDGPEGRDARPGRDARAADGDRRRAARRARRRACRRRRSSRTCCSRCSGATASRRSRSSPLARRRTASTPRSRRRASP